MGEFEWIAHIAKKAKLRPDVLEGIGDDTAVLDIPGSSKVWLLTVDHVVEGIHFEKGIDERWVGRKALARSLSDIAAMGGVPKFVLVGLGVPKGYSTQAIHRFYDGFLKLAEQFKVSLIGGDITRSLKGFFASVTVIGEAKKGEYVLRKGARKGDLLFVTGSLGGSRLKKHLKFQPRIKEAQWLTKSKIPSSMIDISDGLLGDLKHILEKSNVGACVWSHCIPVSLDAKKLANSNSSEALKKAFFDGEDYELLFTSRKKDLSWIKTFQKKFRLSATCIGQIIDQPIRIQIEDEKGKKKNISGKGFTHF